MSFRLSFHRSATELTRVDEEMGEFVEAIKRCLEISDNYFVQQSGRQYFLQQHRQYAGYSSPAEVDPIGVGIGRYR